MIKYFFLDRIRNKTNIFWCLIFPLALMTCFKVAFGNLSTVDDITTKNMAVAHVGSDEAYAQAFDTFVDELTQEGTNGDKALFCQKEYENEEAVRKAVIAGELDLAYLVHDGSIEALLPKAYSDTSCAVSKAVADAFMSNYEMIRTAYEVNPMKAQEVIESLGENLSFVKAKESDFVDDAPNTYIWYFYSTLIMGILLNAMAGVDMVANLKADIGYYAMRVSVSPQKKSKLIFEAYAVYLAIGVAINAAQILIMKFVYEIPVGRNPWKLVALIISCNIFSLAFGTLCGCLLKGSPDSRGNKIIAIVMVSSFLSGEMVCVIPGFIETKLPIINDINPATIMNMALYRLAYSNRDFDFYTNFLKIVVMGAICLVISIMCLRREKYASL